MWILLWIRDTDVRQFNVQVLINRVKCSTDAQVIFELHHHVLPHQGLEKGVEKLQQKYTFNLTSYSVMNH